jgi:sigma-B regulation protein RsbU (phosphoserine phosphatase)
MYYLLANTGPMAGSRFDLTEDEYLLGRDPHDCQIPIRDVPAVSRKHARLVRQGNGYAVEDAGSRNGTFVNEDTEKLRGRRVLQPGDVIRICEVSFAFQEESPAPRATASGKTEPMLEGTGQGLGAEMYEDEATPFGSTILKSVPVDMSSSRGAALVASPEVKLAAIMEIMQSLGRALSLDDVLPQVLASLFKIFRQADRGFIVLQTPEGRLVPRWVRLRREDAADTVRISRTIIRKVMESKEAILSADAANDDRFELSQSIADFRIRSMMCAPLLDSEGNALGALQIDTLNQRQRFQAEDLELLATTATQAANAIEKAQLHEAVLRQKEVERDMQVARDVQRGFLPERTPDLAAYEFYDYYEPAEQVGGDYFDYLPMADGRLAVVVADVVGHGVAAALLMAKLSAETRNALYTEPTPADAVTHLNERLAQFNIQRFVTLICVVLDPKSHTAVIVNAGHMAPLWRRTSGLVEQPGEELAGIPLGITSGITYHQTEIGLAPGETLTLFTDGINESTDVTGAFYSIERLRQHVAEKGANPALLGSFVVEDVRHFLGRAPQNDDMCLVCIGRTE